MPLLIHGFQILQLTKKITYIWCGLIIEMVEVVYIT